MLSSHIGPRLKRDFLRELPIELALHILSFVSPLLVFENLADSGLGRRCAYVGEGLVRLAVLETPIGGRTNMEGNVSTPSIPDGCHLTSATSDSLASACFLALRHSTTRDTKRAKRRHPPTPHRHGAQPPRPGSRRVRHHRRLDAAPRGDPGER